MASVQELNCHNLYVVIYLEGLRKSIGYLAALRYEFYFWILHPVVCIIRIVGNTVPATISVVVCFIISYCCFMFRSLFDQLLVEYTIFVIGSYYTNNRYVNCK
jgi:hypothetical protein